MTRISLGDRFGRLVIIERTPVRRNDGGLRTKWLCQCDCGNTKNIDDGSLKMGWTKSCGCMQKEMTSARFSTHKRTKTKLHRTWVNMKTRCLNQKSKCFHNYGGRGIFICPEWMESFEQFAADVGEPPSGDFVSLDRIDNDRGYEPGNVRWAVPVIQGRNRRGLIEVSVDGKTVCLTEAALIRGLNYGTLYSRIFRAGWPLEKAINTPTRAISHASIR